VSVISIPAAAEQVPTVNYMKAHVQSVCRNFRFCFTQLYTEV